MVSPSTLAEPYGRPITVGLPDGTTLTIIAHTRIEQEARPGEPDGEHAIRRYRDILDDLNDVATGLLMEASMHGHTPLQRSAINILNIACGAGEWVDAEADRIRDGKETR